MAWQFLNKKLTKKNRDSSATSADKEAEEEEKKKSRQTIQSHRLLQKQQQHLLEQLHDAWSRIHQETNETQVQTLARCTSLLLSILQTHTTLPFTTITKQYIIKKKHSFRIKKTDFSERERERE
jgi:hypothetical protein